VQSILRIVPLCLSVLACAHAAAPLFSDPFGKTLADGWKWVRENPDAWRLADGALEIRIEPGNMWGDSNNARNILVRELPDADTVAHTVSVTVSNKPTNQYEQVNLVCYYDDSNMVKIGLELVDEKLSLVMGREEKDKTNTIALLPVTATTLQVRFVLRGDEIEGAYRENATGAWQEAGKCELAVDGPPKISLQAYQGPADAEHWAKFTDFKIEKSK